MSKIFPHYKLFNLINQYISTYSYIKITFVSNIRIIFSIFVKYKDYADTKLYKNACNNIYIVTGIY